MKRHQSAGFTLIELLTVIGIMSVIVALALRNYSGFREQAAYGDVAITLANVRTGMDAAVLADPDQPPAQVALVSQLGGGQFSDASARALLPTIRIAQKISISVSYDPNCVGAGCTSEFAMVRHCQGKEYQSWSRFGDGTEVLLEHLPGAGC